MGLGRTERRRAELVLELGSAKDEPGEDRSPRLGRWTFRIDGHGIGSVRTACRQALLHGRFSVHARLTAHLRGSENVVLREGRLPLRPYSLRRSTESVLDELAGWPALACRMLARTGRLEGPRILEDSVVVSPPYERGGKSCGAVREAAGSAVCAVRVFWNGVRGTWRTLFRHDHWNVGLVRCSIRDFLDAGPERDVEWWDPLPVGRFRADPFGVRRDGRILVLYEEMSFDAGRGRIVGETWSEGSDRRLRQTAMDGDGHLSYPYLLQQGGDLYCIPETADQERVVLYRAVDFPTMWEPVTTLLEGFPALDSTLFRHEGRWWLFCTDADAGPRHVLLAWHAPDLEGPWKPHAANPVKIDIHAARPAGTPFRHRGELYRPAQDGARAYGSSVVLNRVAALTPDTFAEEAVRRIELPAGGPFSDGMHTLSAVGPSLTLVDGRRARFSPAAFARRLGSLVGGDGR